MELTKAEVIDILKTQNSFFINYTSGNRPDKLLERAINSEVFKKLEKEELVDCLNHNYSFFHMLNKKQIKDRELQYAAITHPDCTLDHSAFVKYNLSKNIIPITKELVELLLTKDENATHGAFMYGEKYFKELSLKDQRIVAINCYKKDFDYADLRIGAYKVILMDETGETLNTIVQNQEEYATNQNGGTYAKRFGDFITNICSLKNFCGKTMQTTIEKIAGKISDTTNMPKNRLIPGLGINKLREEAVESPTLLRKILSIDKTFDKELFEKSMAAAFGREETFLSEIDALAEYYNSSYNKNPEKSVLKTLVKKSEELRTK
jgi:NTP pyrophosphatase (non-canonical NTP hydrolase)